MNNLQIFKNEQFGEVRTMEEDGKVLFVANDVAKALGYSNPSKATNDHCKKSEMAWGNDSLGRRQEFKVIPEGDLYRLITHSKLPSAEKFESWVFDEVLPSIRKHGAYMTPETLEEAILNPDTIIRIATALKEEQDKNKALAAANTALTVDKQIMQPKADYFDELVDRNLLTNFRETAKQLGIKQTDFINFLLDKKYVYRDKRGKLMPYADKNNGLFEIKETYNEKPSGAGRRR